MKAPILEQTTLHGQGAIGRKEPGRIVLGVLPDERKVHDLSTTCLRERFSPKDKL